MTDLELAWLAGLLEGEGSFSCRIEKSGRRSLRIQLQMCDKDIVDRVALLTNASGPYLRNPGPPRQIIHLICITSYKAERIMKAIFPFMGERRRTKITESLDLWNGRQKKLRERGLKPTCHPERKHGGNGLCEECYSSSRYLPNDPRRRKLSPTSRDWIVI